MIKSQVIEYLSKHNFHPSKKMGQNFLIEENVAKKLVSYIDFKNVDVIVEVGPGLGQLTEQLVQKNIKVICIELDKRLSEHIKTKFLNVELINDDILNVDLFNLLKQYKNPILVSNLPYSISSLMIKKFLQQDKIKNFYCLLQKEYVNRLKATNNNAEYNSLSALTQFYTSLNVLVDVSKNNFIPEPQVDSTFISLKKNNNKWDFSFNKFIQYCFLAKRKTLLNNLKQYYDISKVKRWLNNKGMDVTIRAEKLTAEQLYSLYTLLK